jgi:hypothetical protein
MILEACAFAPLLFVSVRAYVLVRAHVCLKMCERAYVYKRVCASALSHILTTLWISFVCCLFPLAAWESASERLKKKRNEERLPQGKKV